MMHRRLFALLLVLTLAAPAASTAQQPEMPPVGIIDFYGLRRVTPQQARAALGVTEGDSTPRSVAAAVRRLEALPGVARAAVDRVCCEQGKVILYVGVAERGAPTIRFRPAPRGAARLPDEVVRAGAAYDSAFMAAVLRGDAGEDDSQGHALMHDSAARAAQEQFIPLAERHLPRLREVLRGSADAGQRALAAELIAYHPDKRAVVPELVAAMRDPSAGVRNNATRALAVIAVLAQRRPELGIGVPTAPFVDMLNSLVWTDRNKSSIALGRLTVTRDPALLATLRARALPALVDIARWKAPGHASSGIVILGRIAGWSEERIGQAMQNGEREAVIAAARGGQRHEAVP